MSQAQTQNQTQTSTSTSTPTAPHEKEVDLPYTYLTQEFNGKLKHLSTLPHVPFVIDMKDYEEEGGYVFLHPQTGKELTMAEALDNIQAVSLDKNFVAAWYEANFKEPKFVWLLKTDLQLYRNNSSSSIRVDNGVVQLMRGNYTVLASAYVPLYQN